MNDFIKFLFIISLLGCAACEKSEPSPIPFLTNAFALQNDSNQQFIYTPETVAEDSMHLYFEAATNSVLVPGQIHFYIMFTDTMDTLWLDSSAQYWYAYGDVLGDRYTLDTSAKNYVLFQSNNPIAKSSGGIFQARFLFDTTTTRIDTLSPDTMRLDSGTFSGPYIQ